MEPNKINRVFFLGIGGIGMSALARYFKKKGAYVVGYDKTRTELCTLLDQEGIQILYEDNPAAIPENFRQPSPETLLVYTPAVPKSIQLYRYFVEAGFELFKRSEVLGIISRNMFCIAVAGTHGKTTTSSLIAHVLHDSGYGCTAFLGGIASNNDGNILIANNDVLVVEADEYDRSFLTLNPDVAVVTSMDADHLDIYGNIEQLLSSFRLFAAQIKKDGTLFIKEGLPLKMGKSYGLNNTANCRASNIKIVANRFVFDYEDDTHHINNLTLQLPGVHNIENTIAAIAVALKMGVDEVKIRTALSNFQGIKRRFEYVLNTPTCIYVDDYAHHPEELKACFKAIRQLYPDKKLTVIFQPHLFSRTRDFAHEFAEVLATVDALILLEIYPARETPIDGVNAKMLLDRIDIPNKRICTKEETLRHIDFSKPELLLTVGAGDIDLLVTPLKMKLQDGN